jgi:hypothetical protein
MRIAEGGRAAPRQISLAEEMAILKRQIAQNAIKRAQEEARKAARKENQQQRSQAKTETAASHKKAEKAINTYNNQVDTHQKSWVKNHSKAIATMTDKQLQKAWWNDWVKSSQGTAAIEKLDPYLKDYGSKVQHELRLAGAGAGDDPAKAKKAIEDRAKELRKEHSGTDADKMLDGQVTDAEKLVKGESPELRDATIATMDAKEAKDKAKENAAAEVRKLEDQRDKALAGIHNGFLKQETRDAYDELIDAAKAKVTEAETDLAEAYQKELAVDIADREVKAAQKGDGGQNPADAYANLTRAQQQRDDVLTGEINLKYLSDGSVDGALKDLYARHPELHDKDSPSGLSSQGEEIWTYGQALKKRPEIDAGMDKLPEIAADSATQDWMKDLIKSDPVSAGMIAALKGKDASGKEVPLYTIKPANGDEVNLAKASPMTFAMLKYLGQTFDLKHSDKNPQPQDFIEAGQKQLGTAYKKLSKSGTEQQKIDLDDLQLLMAASGDVRVEYVEQEWDNVVATETPKQSLDKIIKEDLEAEDYNNPDYEPNSEFTKFLKTLNTQMQNVFLPGQDAQIWDAVDSDVTSFINAQGSLLKGMYDDADPHKGEKGNVTTMTGEWLKQLGQFASPVVADAVIDATTANLEPTMISQHGGGRMTDGLRLLADRAGLESAGKLADWATDVSEKERLQVPLRDLMTVDEDGTGVTLGQALLDEMTADGVEEYALKDATSTYQAGVDRATKKQQEKNGAAQVEAFNNGRDQNLQEIFDGALKDNGDVFTKKLNFGTDPVSDNKYGDMLGLKPDNPDAKGDEAKYTNPGKLKKIHDLKQIDWISRGANMPVDLSLVAPLIAAGKDPLDLKDVTGISANAKLPVDLSALTALIKEGKNPLEALDPDTYDNLKKIRQIQDWTTRIGGENALVTFTPTIYASDKTGVSPLYLMRVEGDKNNDGVITRDETTRSVGGKGGARTVKLDDEDMVIDTSAAGVDNAPWQYTDFKNFRDDNRLDDHGRLYLTGSDDFLLHDDDNDGKVDKINFEGVDASITNWAERWGDRVIGIGTGVATLASFVPVLTPFAAPLALLGGTYLGIRSAQHLGEMHEHGQSWNSREGYMQIGMVVLSGLPILAGGLRTAALFGQGMTRFAALRVGIGAVRPKTPFLADAQTLLNTGGSLIRTARVADRAGIAIGLPLMEESTRDLAMNWDNMHWADRVNGVLGAVTGLYGTGKGIQSEIMHRQAQRADAAANASQAGNNLPITVRPINVLPAGTNGPVSISTVTSLNGGLRVPVVVPSVNGSQGGHGQTSQQQSGAHVPTVIASVTPLHGRAPKQNGRQQGGAHVPVAVAVDSNPVTSVDLLAPAARLDGGTPEGEAAPVQFPTGIALELNGFNSFPWQRPEVVTTSGERMTPAELALAIDKQSRENGTSWTDKDYVILNLESGGLVYMGNDGKTKPSVSWEMRMRPRIDALGRSRLFEQDFANIIGKPVAVPKGRADAPLTPEYWHVFRPETETPAAYSLRYDSQGGLSRLTAGRGKRHQFSPRQVLGPVLSTGENSITLKLGQFQVEIFRPREGSAEDFARARFEEISQADPNAKLTTILGEPAIVTNPIRVEVSAFKQKFAKWLPRRVMETDLDVQILPPGQFSARYREAGGKLNSRQLSGFTDLRTRSNGLPVVVLRQGRENVGPHEYAHALASEAFRERASTLSLESDPASVSFEEGAAEYSYFKVTAPREFTERKGGYAAYMAHLAETTGAGADAPAYRNVTLAIERIADSMGEDAFFSARYGGDEAAIARFNETVESLYGKQIRISEAPPILQARTGPGGAPKRKVLTGSEYVADEWPAFWADLQANNLNSAQNQYLYVVHTPQATGPVAFTSADVEYYATIPANSNRVQWRKGTPDDVNGATAADVFGPVPAGKYVRFVLTNQVPNSVMRTQMPMQVAAPGAPLPPPPTGLPAPRPAPRTPKVPATAPGKTIPGEGYLGSTWHTFNTRIQRGDIKYLGERYIYVVEVPRSGTLAFKASDIRAVGRLQRDATQVSWTGVNWGTPSSKRITVDASKSKVNDIFGQPQRGRVYKFVVSHVRPENLPAGTMNVSFPTGVAKTPHAPTPRTISTAPLPKDPLGNPYRASPPGQEKLVTNIAREAANLPTLDDVMTSLYSGKPPKFEPTPLIVQLTDVIHYNDRIERLAHQAHEHPEGYDARFTPDNPANIFIRSVRPAVRKIGKATNTVETRYWEFANGEHPVLGRVPVVRGRLALPGQTRIVPERFLQVRGRATGTPYTMRLALVRGPYSEVWIAGIPQGCGVSHYTGLDPRAPTYKGSPELDLRHIQDYQVALTNYAKWQQYMHEAAGEKSPEIASEIDKLAMRREDENLAKYLQSEGISDKLSKKILNLATTDKTRPHLALNMHVAITGFNPASKDAASYLIDRYLEFYQLIAGQGETTLLKENIRNQLKTLGEDFDFDNPDHRLAAMMWLTTAKFFDKHSVIHSDNSITSVGKDGRVEPKTGSYEPREKLMKLLGPFAKGGGITHAHAGGGRDAILDATPVPNTHPDINGLNYGPEISKQVDAMEITARDHPEMLSDNSWNDNSLAVGSNAKLRRDYQIFARRHPNLVNGSDTVKPVNVGQARQHGTDDLPWKMELGLTDKEALFNMMRKSFEKTVHDGKITKDDVLSIADRFDNLASRIEAGNSKIPGKSDPILEGIADAFIKETATAGKDSTVEMLRGLATKLRGAPAPKEYPIMDAVWNGVQAKDSTGAVRIGADGNPVYLVRGRKQMREEAEKEFEALNFEDVRAVVENWGDPSLPAIQPPTGDLPPALTRGKPIAFDTSDTLQVGTSAGYPRASVGRGQAMKELVADLSPVVIGAALGVIPLPGVGDVVTLVRQRLFQKNVDGVETERLRWENIHEEAQVSDEALSVFLAQVLRVGSEIGVDRADLQTLAVLLKQLHTDIAFIREATKGWPPERNKQVFDMMIAAVGNSQIRADGTTGVQASGLSTTNPRTAGGRKRLMGINLTATASMGASGWATWAAFHNPDLPKAFLYTEGGVSAVQTGVTWLALGTMIGRNIWASRAGRALRNPELNPKYSRLQHIVLSSIEGSAALGALYNSTMLFTPKHGGLWEPAIEGAIAAGTYVAARRARQAEKDKNANYGTLLPAQQADVTKKVLGLLALGAVTSLFFYGMDSGDAYFDKEEAEDKLADVKSVLDNEKKELKTAETTLTKKESDFTTAEDKLTKAEDKLSNASAADKQRLQTERDNAETERNAARTAYTTAVKARDKAQKEVDTATKNVDSAKKELDKAKAALSSLFSLV